jgi:hypothetical protein
VDGDELAGAEGGNGETDDVASTWFVDDPRMGRGPTCESTDTVGYE